MSETSRTTKPTKVNAPGTETWTDEKWSQLWVHLKRIFDSIPYESSHSAHYKFPMTLAIFDDGDWGIGTPEMHSLAKKPYVEVIEISLSSIGGFDSAEQFADHVIAIAGYTGDFLNRDLRVLPLTRIVVDDDGNLLGEETLVGRYIEEFSGSISIDLKGGEFCAVVDREGNATVYRPSDCDDIPKLQAAGMLSVSRTIIEYMEKSLLDNTFDLVVDGSDDDTGDMDDADTGDPNEQN